MVMLVEPLLGGLSTSSSGGIADTTLDEEEVRVLCTIGGQGGGIDGLVWTGGTSRAIFSPGECAWSIGRKMGILGGIGMEIVFYRNLAALL